MKAKTKLKIIVDMAMTIAMLLLMTYGLIGEAAHEWIGLAMFVLVILHNILNSHFHKNIVKGKHTAIRNFQTILVALIILSMLGSMVSGMILSRHIFTYKLIPNASGLATKVHMLCAYWGFALMSMHLGSHWNMIVGMIKKSLKHVPSVPKNVFLIVKIIIFVYGVYAFVSEKIWRYMFLLDHFVFFDFDRPLALFLVNYLAIMGMFVMVGSSTATLLKRTKK